MIDEQKVIGMLQAKALNCLDQDDKSKLQDYIDAGHVFPWDELGVYQYVASLLPLTLKLETPDVELKDRVALRLIKLRDELRAKKSLEDELLKAQETTEIIEEEIDENINEFESAEETFDESQIEVESDPEVDVETNSEIEDLSEVDPVSSEVVEDLNEPLNYEESTFNLDEVTLPDIETNNITEPEPNFDELKSEVNESTIQNLIDEPPIETKVEERTEEVKIETPTVEEVDITSVVEEQPSNKFDLNDETTPAIVNEFAQPEEIKETEKTPDFTKRSVAEKVFKTIEQDFDALKYRYEKSERKLTRGQLMSYVIMALLFALLVFSFFKFSADIKLLEREIKSLKNNSTSSMMNNKNITSDFYFFS